MSGIGDGIASAAMWLAISNIVTRSIEVGGITLLCFGAYRLISRLIAKLPSD